MSPAAAPEHVEAAMLVRAVRGAVDTWPELELFHAIPNGGHRARRTAAKLKAEGVLPGVPDYCLPVPRGGFHGLYIELKSLTGYASREQRQFIANVRRHGYRAEVCRGWEQAWAVIRDYLAADGQQEEAA